MAVETHQKVGVRELKKHLSQIIDEIIQSGEPVTVTRHGKPVVEIAPVSQMSKDEYIEKYLKGSVVYFKETHHDTIDEWDILKDNATS